MNPNLLCRRAETVLKIAYNWSRTRGLNINPRNGTMIFYQGDLDKPVFRQETSNNSSNVKDLEAILDKTLSKKTTKFTEAGQNFNMGTKSKNDPLSVVW